MATELARYGVASHPAASPRQAATALVRVARQGRLDIVHAHMTEAETVAVGLKPLVRRPVVATRHFARPRGAPGVRRRIFSTFHHLLDAQVAISAFVAHETGEEASVVPHGLPVGGPPAPDEERDKVVLVAQRFEPEKRTGDTLELFARSGLAADGWELHLAGEGAEGAALHRRAEQLGIESSVRFLGFVKDLGEVMARCRIFIATTPADGFGLSVAEAMLAGMPVVACASGGHLETVGVVAPDLLYQPGDLVAGAAVLGRLGADAGLRQRRGSQLRHCGLERFSLERHAEGLLAVYHRVLGDRSATAAR